MEDRFDVGQHPTAPSATTTLLPIQQSLKQALRNAKRITKHTLTAILNKHLRKTPNTTSAKTKIIATALHSLAHKKDIYNNIVFPLLKNTQALAHNKTLHSLQTIDWTTGQDSTTTHIKPLPTLYVALLDALAENTNDSEILLSERIDLANAVAANLRSQQGRLGTMGMRNLFRITRYDLSADPMAMLIQHIQSGERPQISTFNEMLAVIMHHRACHAHDAALKADCTFATNGEANGEHSIGGERMESCIDGGEARVQAGDVRGALHCSAPLLLETLGVLMMRPNGRTLELLLRIARDESELFLIHSILPRRLPENLDHAFLVAHASINAVAAAEEVSARLRRDSKPVSQGVLFAVLKNLCVSGRSERARLLVRNLWERGGHLGDKQSRALVNLAGEIVANTGCEVERKIAKELLLDIRAAMFGGSRKDPIDVALPSMPDFRSAYAVSQRRHRRRSATNAHETIRALVRAEWRAGIYTCDQAVERCISLLSEEEIAARPVLVPTFVYMLMRGGNEEAAFHMLRGSYSSNLASYPTYPLIVHENSYVAALRALGREGPRKSALDLASRVLHEMIRNRIVPSVAVYAELCALSGRLRIAGGRRPVPGSSRFWKEYVPMACEKELHDLRALGVPEALIADLVMASVFAAALDRLAEIMEAGGESALLRSAMLRIRK